jgi:hypothetical protein
MKLKSYTTTNLVHDAPISLPGPPAQLFNSIVCSCNSESLIPRHD